MIYLFVSDVEDTHHRLAFLDSGAVLNLPLFYLEGIYLGFFFGSNWNGNGLVVWHMRV